MSHLLSKCYLFLCIHVALKLTYRTSKVIKCTLVLVLQLVNQLDSFFNDAKVVLPIRKISPAYLLLVLHLAYVKTTVLDLHSHDLACVQKDTKYIRSVEPEIPDGFGCCCLTVVDVDLDWSLPSQIDHFFIGSQTVSLEHNLLVYILPIILSIELTSSGGMPTQKDINKIIIGNIIVYLEQT